MLGPVSGRHHSLEVSFRCPPQSLHFSGTRAASCDFEARSVTRHVGSKLLSGDGNLLRRIGKTDEAVARIRIREYDGWSGYEVMV